MVYGHIWGPSRIVVAYVHITRNDKEEKEREREKSPFEVGRYLAYGYVCVSHCIRDHLWPRPMSFSLFLFLLLSLSLSLSPPFLCPCSRSLPSWFVRGDAPSLRRTIALPISVITACETRVRFLLLFSSFSFSSFFFSFRLSYRILAWPSLCPFFSTLRLFLSPRRETDTAKNALAVWLKIAMRRLL